MNGRFLLDTNIVIALFSGEANVCEHLRNLEQTFVPAIVLGELYFGAHKSKHPHENLERIDQFVMSTSILTCGTDTAKLYGDIKNTLRSKGRPIPENDIWIAALTRQYQLTLVTRDYHFNEVENIKLQIW